MDYNTINWKNDISKFLDYLFTLEDKKYKDFSKKITLLSYEMIGIRIPILKSIAKQITKTNYQEFIEFIPDTVFEYKMLKGLVIANIKDIREYKTYFQEYLPLIDNWAICDIFLSSSKIIKKDYEYFFNLAVSLIKNSTQEFENRVGFVILLDYFIIDNYVSKIPSIIKDYNSDKYYANMALAWLISIIYIKYHDIGKNILPNLNKEVLNMVKRKIKDSYRVRIEDKEYLNQIN